MKLLIDNREPQSIIKYINALNSSAKDKITVELRNLDIGDYIFYDEISSKNIIIIERKSLADLEASIKDGRYNEQSFRLNDCDVPNHDIFYLIEGNVINHRNDKFKNTLYSSLFSLSYYKGFSVFNSANNVESAEIIFNFANKLVREKMKPGFYTTFLNNLNNLNIENPDEDEPPAYSEVIKPAKKSYVTENNIMEIMLMQIPGISCQTGMALKKEFKTIGNLIDNLKNNPECLANIKLESGRKINKTCIESIKKYLVKET